MTTIWVILLEERASGSGCIFDIHMNAMRSHYGKYQGQSRFCQGNRKIAAYAPGQIHTQMIAAVGADERADAAEENAARKWLLE